MNPGPWWQEMTTAHEGRRDKSPGHATHNPTVVIETCIYVQLSHKDPGVEGSGSTAQARLGQRDPGRTPPFTAPGHLAADVQGGPQETPF